VLESKPQTKQQYVYFVLISLITAVAFGFSFGDASSNHPTYLPPGIQLANPNFLTNDWWLNSVTHYHFAFNFLISTLTKFNILAWGTGAINLVVVTTGLFFIFKLFSHINQKWAVCAFFATCSSYFLTDSFDSVASTYLFTSGLQASNIASCATLGAILSFAKARFLFCGLWLALAGIFHVNFLLVNIVAFSFAFVIYRNNNLLNIHKVKKQDLRDFSYIAFPSFVLIVFFLPLILKLSNPSQDPEIIAQARHAFFEFAVPFHYLPNTFLIDFLGLLGWQLMGVSFLILGNSKARIFSLQLSMIALIWIATALTTFVFIESVSRLFFWRLSPFSLCLSCVSIYFGISALLRPEAQYKKRTLIISVLGAATGALLILRLQFYYYELTEPRAILFVLLLGAVCFIPFFKLLQGYLPTLAKLPLNSEKLLTNISLGLALVILSGSYYITFDARKYSLFFLTEEELHKRDLYSFVNSNTSPQANILIPPDLSSFRLFSGRSVVVDTKALPFDQVSLAEWYQRLEDISGIIQPKSIEDVALGYNSLDQQRLDKLMTKFNISHVVLNKQQNNRFKGWEQIFENSDFRLPFW